MVCEMDRTSEPVDPAGKENFLGQVISMAAKLDVNETYTLFGPKLPRSTLLVSMEISNPDPLAMVSSHALSVSGSSKFEFDIVAIMEHSGAVL